MLTSKNVMCVIYEGSLNIKNWIYDKISGIII